MKLKSILLFASGILMVSNAFAQYKVTTGGQKYTLVEEATGPGCGYCPDGAQDIEQAIEGVYPRAIIASWHGSTYDGSNMVVSGDPFCTGTGYVLGFPAAAIDRTAQLDIHEATPAMAVGLNRPWENWVSTQNALTPNFDVSMKCVYAPHAASDTARADSSTATLTITLTGKALSAVTGKRNINVFITEDSISSAASAFQQHSYMYDATYGPCCDGSPCWFTGLCTSSCGGGCSSCAFLPPASYSHMNVVRAVLATGGSVFGDTAFTNPAVGATYAKTYTYRFDTTKFNPLRMKVIGMVQTPGPANRTGGNPIENSIQSRVRLMPHSLSATGEPEISNAMTEIKLYPNPAKNNITVKGVLGNPSDTRIEIYNTAGQVVIKKEYKSGGSIFGENIELNNISSGTYFMSIINNGEIVTKQFTVTK